MIKKGLALLLIVIAVYWSFYALMPNTISTIDEADNSFSTHRALIHLKEISKETHYLGSKSHKDIRDYIITELNKLGLKTQIQEGFSLSENWGSVSKPKNIIAKIKGSEKGKALLLLTHYDSSPHSSFGASDAGSGVVTILEGIRAFLSENKAPKNDIIILISDSEELGLNGADLFVNKHEWAKDVGLVLNFEARGSGGPSYMLLETNQGNANLMKAFVDANPEFPVANSLAYSIYKMLPNDTDLTVFRRDGNIDGFNFAFIDDHYDYHSALDTYERLDRETLEHQGSYLMPLLHYFSNANLNNLKSVEDYIYFNVPLFKTVIYPFSWIIPMLILSIVIFIVLLFYGFKRQTIQAKEVSKGFIAFFSTLILSGLLGFLGWEFIKILYPDYKEILHGFTYNGHTYIAAFTCLTIAIYFYIYHKVTASENTASLMIAPLFFWLLICGLIAFKLEGASFFIVPVLFGLLSCYMLVVQKKPSLILLALLGFPVLMIMSPLVKMFSVGLGLKILFVSVIIVVLIAGLLISVFGFFKHKKRFATIFLLLGLYFLISAHFTSHFSETRPKPNSILYILDTNNNSAIWATYDDVLDSWTKNILGNEPDQSSNSSPFTFGSKYKSNFSFTKQAPLKAIIQPKIEMIKDTIIGDLRHIKVIVTSRRDAERIEVFSDSTSIFKSFIINGVSAHVDKNNDTAFNKRYNNRLFGYYITDNDPLDIAFTVPKNQSATLHFYEISYDLLHNDLFSVPNRQIDMIPKPFVINDAIVIKRTFYH